MLSGYCLGGGVAIALGCDLRIAGDNLRYGIPAAKLGVGYGWRGVRKLVDTVGSAHARELFLTGRQFDAGHALKTGFAHRVVAAAELDVALREECRLLAGNAPLTIRSIKQIMNELARGEHDMDVARCEAATREVFASEDFLEGRSAFMQRRAPRFEGK
jgi:enoyl-CoA hydratase/carnithine racemase